MKVPTDKQFSVTLFEDNQSTIKVGKSVEQPKRLKHVDVRYHFVQEKIRQKIITLKYVETEKQVADILTKPLAWVKFARLRELLF